MRSSSRRLTAVAGTLSALLWLSLAAAQQQPSLSAVEQRQVYEEAIHILGGNVNVISRWQREIRLRVVGAASAEGARRAARILAEVTAQISLPLRAVTEPPLTAGDYLAELARSPRFTLGECAGDDSSCANFVVIFSSAADMQAIAKAIPLRPVYQQAFNRGQAPLCFFSPFQTGYLEITQALVYVRDDLPARMLETCLQEEIYQSFGLFNDAGGSRFFSFNNVVQPKSITRYDKALLQAIYDPEFRPGAPVFRVVKRLMDNLGFDQFQH